MVNEALRSSTANERKAKRYQQQEQDHFDHGSDILEPSEDFVWKSEDRQAKDAEYRHWGLMVSCAEGSNEISCVMVVYLRSAPCGITPSAQKLTSIAKNTASAPKTAVHPDAHKSAEDQQHLHERRDSAYPTIPQSQRRRPQQGRPSVQHNQ
jgi:hypothetical protein